MSSTPVHNNGIERNKFEWVLKHVAIYSVIILSTPFLIWIVWTFVKGRGKWRLRNPGNKPHYVRTWHGWVEAEDTANSILRHARLRHTIQKKFIWKTTTADHSWIFWDADGTKYQKYRFQRDKSILRYLPTWLRSFEAGSLLPGSRFAPNRLGAAEEGKISLRSFRHSSEIQPMGFSFTRHQAWARSHARRRDIPAQNNTLDGFEFMMTGAIEDSQNEEGSGTVRRRRSSGQEVQVWNANSQETLRATQTQFLSAKKSTNVQPGPGPHNVFNDLARRTSSLPPFVALRNAYHSRRWPLPLHSQTTQMRYPDRALQGVRPPENSEDDLHRSCYDSSRRQIPKYLHTPMPRQETEFMQNPSQKLEIAKSVVLNPLASVGAEYSGTAGRPGSPAMGWTSHWEPREACSHRLSEYEEDGNLEGASSFQCSSRASSSLYACSSIENNFLNSDEGLLPQAKTLNIASKLEKSGRMGVHSARRLLASDGAFKGSYAPGEINLDPCRPQQAGYTSWSTLTLSEKFGKALPEAFPTEHVSFIENLPLPVNPHTKNGTEESVYSLRRTKNKPAERIPLSVLRESNQTPSPTKSTTISRTTTKIFGIESSSGESNLSTFTKETPKATEVLSSNEKYFLDDLDRRLDRLNYELSPGFRGPQGDSTDPKWWFEAIPFSASVACRAPQPHLRAAPTLTTPLNVCPVLRRSFTTSNLSKTKNSSDTTSKHKRATSAQELPGYTSPYKSEPDKGAIDTAAWMLRRPPMGALREDSAEKTYLFTSGRGPAKTLSEWQQSDPFQPLKQVLDSASKISKLPAKHLKRLGKLGVGRNENRDEKKKHHGGLKLGSGENVRDGVPETTRRPPCAAVETSLVTRRMTESMSVVMDVNVDWNYMGMRSPNHTMMQ